MERRLFKCRDEARGLGSCSLHRKFFSKFQQRLIQKVISYQEYDLRSGPQNDQNSVISFCTFSPRHPDQNISSKR